MATQTLASTPTVKLLTISKIQKASADETATLLKVHVTSTNASREMEVLPESGADTSAAGAEMLQYLNEHVGSLHPSTVTPKAVNSMYQTTPFGKVTSQATSRQS